MCVFNVVIDRLVAELDRRYQSYNTIFDSFRFVSTLLKTSSHLAGEFDEEVIPFQQYVQKDFNASPLAGELLKSLRRKGLRNVFPNLDIALCFFLTLPVTNARGD